MIYLPNTNARIAYLVRGIGETSQIAVASFRQRLSVRSGKPPGVTDCRGFVSSSPLGSFGELVRRYKSMARNKARNHPRSHALRGNALLDAPRRPCFEERGTQSVPDGIPTQSVGTSFSRLLALCRVVVANCRGFVSSLTFGSFGETTRRHSLPWLCLATTLDNGFVSSRRYRLPWLRFVSGGVRPCKPRHRGSGRSGLSNCQGS